MKRLFWIPWVLGLAIVAGALVLVTGGSLYIFLDVASLVITLGISFVLLLTHFSFKEIGSAFRYALERTEYNEGEIRKGIVFFKSMRNFLIVSGIFGLFTAAIAMLRYDAQQRSDTTNMAVGASVALICMFYSIVTLLLLEEPFRSALEKRLETGK